MTALACERQTNAAGCKLRHAAVGLAQYNPLAAGICHTLTPSIESNKNRCCLMATQSSGIIDKRSIAW
jgi:hypothetical protein